jgi:hypothetical protein
VIVDNTSNAVVARDIKWTVTLLNVEHPDVHNYLPMPPRGGDWIKPGNSQQGADLFVLSETEGLVKKGDRLVGTASVSCACALFEHTT